MTLQSYYRRALVLPLVAPFVALPLLFLGDDLAYLAVMLQYQVMVGGIPYLIFAGAFLLWSRGRSARQVHAGILLSPLLYAATVVVCGLAVAAVIGAWGWPIMRLLVVYAVVLGYGYVLIADLLYRLLSHRGVIRPESA